MTYQPVLPTGGNLGWTFLKQTRDAQQETFDNSTSIVVNKDYFRENVGDIQTAEDLVNDRRLLSVALGAFGLDEDINNKYFIQKVLEEGTLDEDSFANRLADKRYFAMAEAFGFDLQPPNTVLSTFPDSVLEQYSERQFEIAIGEQDENLRLAMGLERELANLSQRDLTEDAAWFTVMGTPAVREVFEKALGLPSETVGVDIDRQLDMFRDKSQKLFGTTNPTDFVDPDLQEKLVRNFLVRADLSGAASTNLRGTVALSLLQSQVSLF